VEAGVPPLVPATLAPLAAGVTVDPTTPPGLPPPPPQADNITAKITITNFFIKNMVFPLRAILIASLTLMLCRTAAMLSRFGSGLIANIGEDYRFGHHC
jgi:hypothetical protein